MYMPCNSYFFHYYVFLFAAYVCGERCLHSYCKDLTQASFIKMNDLDLEASGLVPVRTKTPQGDIGSLSLGHMTLRSL